MSISTTPSKMATAGSTFRGMPRSISNSGSSSLRPVAASSTIERSMIGWVVATEVKTTSALAMSDTRSARSPSTPTTWPIPGARRPLRRPFGSAVGDDQAGCPLSSQGLGHALTHLAGPDDQDPGAGQTSVSTIGGECHGPMGQRGDAPGDGRLGTDPLARLDGMAEQGSEHRTRDVLTWAFSHAFAPGREPRTPRVPLSRARSNGEQMVGHLVVEPHGQMAVEQLGRAAGDGGQEVLEVGDALVEPLDHGVDLGAQARRQDDRLGDVRLVPETTERLRQGALGHRHPLQEVEGGLALLYANHDYRHLCPLAALGWLDWCVTGTRPWSGWRR